MVRYDIGYLENQKLYSSNLLYIIVIVDAKFKRQQIKFS